MTEFGKQIRYLRKEKMLTQRELANFLGVTPTYISKIENNNFEVLPSDEVIANLAKYLEVEENYLFELSGKIDTKTLQDRAIEDTDTAYLLRRIQKGLPKERIQKLVDEIKDDE